MSEPIGSTSQGLESLGRIRRQGILLLTIAFLTGAIFGGAVMRVRDVRHAPRGAMRGPDWRGGRLGPRGFPPQLEELGLSDQQHKQIEQILERRRPVTDSILRHSLPVLRAAMDSTRAEIRTVLTPDQRTKLDRMERRFRPERSDSGAPPPPPR